MSCMQIYIYLSIYHHSSQTASHVATYSGHVSLINVHDNAGRHITHIYYIFLSPKKGRIIFKLPRTFHEFHVHLWLHQHKSVPQYSHHPHCMYSGTQEDHKDIQPPLLDQLKIYELVICVTVKSNNKTMNTSFVC